MAQTNIKQKIHPSDSELADMLSGVVPAEKRKIIEEHIASCEECLNTIVSACESVGSAGIKTTHKRGTIMKKINIYLILCLISFALSFAFPRYFIQFLVATLLLGIKWIVDAKSTRMLVMIYEAWKHGGEKEASRILESMDSGSKNRRW